MNSTSMFDIPVFPQTITMDEIHRKILDTTHRSYLEEEVDVSDKVLSHFVQSDVFTDSMAKAIKVC